MSIVSIDPGLSDKVKDQYISIYAMHHMKVYDLP